MAIRNSAKAIVIDRGRILLNRCTSRFGEYYALPGGGQNPGETLIETVKRELLEETGYEVNPDPFEKRHDIIQTVKLGSAEGLVEFCRGIQSASPVDAFVDPEPWDMPGYDDPVVMAAGAFVGGASIELSADGPVRPPYIAFMQGGLTYESARLAIMAAAERCGRFNG